MMTNVQLTGVKVARVATHYYPPSPKTGSEFFSVSIDTEPGNLTLLLTREQMDRICVAMGHALIDSDPKAPALMERDHTAPTNGSYPALETWHAIDIRTGAILYSVQASNYGDAALSCAAARLKSKWECCKASDMEGEQPALLA